MLELSRSALCAIRCCARPSAIAQLGRPELTGMIAPDELLLLVTASELPQVLADVTAELEASDPSALVVDHSDAFALMTLSGSFREAAARLSHIALPDAGFVQGPVAGVACKMFVAPDRLHLLAPSTYRDHVRERIFAACADLGVRETAFSEGIAPAPTTTSA